MTPSPLQKSRLDYVPKIPRILADIEHLELVEDPSYTAHISEEIGALFPHLKKQKALRVHSGASVKGKPLRVAAVFSGGQASGGHNVVIGIFDALQKKYPGSVLYGFLDGPSGILEGKYKELTGEVLAAYRNQGGFDLLGSGRTKIDKPEQFEVVAKRMQEMALDGLVVIGGDDSNTNAALLAEYFLAHNISTSVVGVPKTIDGDLRGHGIEISFGFDTASKTYAATIGSLLRDALSAKKYYYFVKLMGRSASHVAMECALLTHPNMTLIGEEIAAKKTTLAQVVDQLTTMIIERSKQQKDYGVVLIPEGVIEFIDDVKHLIEELNALLAQNNLENVLNPDDKIAAVEKLLTPNAQNCFKELPRDTKLQLLLGRDPHGNVQVSKIETERMFIAMIQDALKKRGFAGKFNPQPIFCGYEGRSCLPTNFDANYCTALGYMAATLIGAHKTGYICAMSDLTKDADSWKCGAIPLVGLMTIEKRMGKNKPVIEKALVDLKGPFFTAFVKQRDSWALNDAYTDPGPIQFA